MNRECPTRLWLSTLLIFWGWGLGCAPAGEQDSGVAPPAPTAVLPEAEAVRPVEIVRTNDYSEGVVIDHEGNIYFSHEKVITVVTPEGEDRVWAETGEPNGHKILADGTHLVCDATHHAVLRLDAEGNMLEPASTECEGKPLKGPNDLTLDPEGGFYFTDPEGTGISNPIGTVHYVDPEGTTHLVAGGLAYPNGIVLTPEPPPAAGGGKSEEPHPALRGALAGQGRSDAGVCRSAHQGRRSDRQPARRHLSGCRGKSLRGPLRDAPGSGIRPRGEAHPPLSRGKPHHQQLRLRGSQAGSTLRHGRHTRRAFPTGSGCARSGHSPQTEREPF